MAGRPRKKKEEDIEIPENTVNSMDNTFTFIDGVVSPTTNWKYSIPPGHFYNIEIDILSDSLIESLEKNEIIFPSIDTKNLDIIVYHNMPPIITHVSNIEESYSLKIYNPTKYYTSIVNDMLKFYKIQLTN